MKFGDYVYSKAVTLCFLGIGAIVLGTALSVSGTAFGLILMLLVLFGALAFGWLVSSFFFENARIRKLKKVTEELPERYLLGEVMPKPVHALEYQYYEVMKEISRSAIALTQQAVQEKEEYCEYVEAWIHEMRTPLTACSLILDRMEVQNRLPENAYKEAETQVQLSEREFGEDLTFLSETMRKLRRELKRADNLTENILYYARIREAGNETQIHVVRARDLIRDAMQSQRDLLTAAGISAEVDGDFQIYTDGKTVCFILKQLLINCAKYCPGCHVRIHAAEGKIEVEDNGIGIPSQELRRVTQRGYTGSNGKRLGGSTGMGLYIAKELCSRLDIGFVIESEEGRYTRITLAFPDGAARKER